MTTTPDLLALPARRRRHARRIAELTSLIGSCAEAAGAVYGPIAAAPPEQDNVEVTLIPCHQVSLVASIALERARAADAARWPAALQQEEAEAERTRAARHAVASAQEAASPTEQPTSPYTVPLPTVEQAVVIDLVAAGSEIAELWQEDRGKAVVRLCEFIAGGEFTESEVLDKAADAAEQAGLLALQDARAAKDPSKAAELLLAAAPHFVAAVHLLSWE